MPPPGDLDIASGESGQALAPRRRVCGGISRWGHPAARVADGPIRDNSPHLRQRRRVREHAEERARVTTQALEPTLTAWMRRMERWRTLRGMGRRVVAAGASHGFVPVASGRARRTKQRRRAIRGEWPVGTRERLRSGTELGGADSLNSA
ncbi:hypothetical protein WOLCODRAFT_154540 [Wolfiporia cocos MD-104 SS10]|uniref:Uncharacterized protein n=1 Tax=Wolfiporia cocos (strain MD-104) TaxID=742152 RepID=A0A2H3JSN5_WOLCO|nr:hypothetical protein WOLCODRAFT_154540 [Wolfiporia cocos MD-104 SS10]